MPDCVTEAPPSSRLPDGREVVNAQCVGMERLVGMRVFHPSEQWGYVPLWDGKDEDGVERQFDEGVVIQAAKRSDGHDLDLRYRLAGDTVTFRYSAMFCWVLRGDFDRVVGP